MGSPVAFESVSTWQQPLPAPLSATRDEVVQQVALRIDGLGRHRLRVAVDGRTAAGKTSFAHEIAQALRAVGRPTLRASLDDFKRPWRDRHLYDRVSGEGYYRNAQDQDAVVDLLLRPAGPSGSGRVGCAASIPSPSATTPTWSWTHPTTLCWWSTASLPFAMPTARSGT